MKLLYTLALVMTLGSTATAQTTEQCYQTSELLYTMAEHRDDGFEPQKALETLLLMGFPRDTSQEMVLYVYFVEGESSPSKVQESFMNKCAGTTM